MNEPPKPLHFCLSPGAVTGGGIGMMMLNLAEGLLARGHRVDLLHLGELAGRVPPDGCNAICLGLRARAAWPKAKSYLKTAQPDCIISARDYINLLMLGARAASSVPSIKTKLIWSYHTHRASEMAYEARGLDRAADWLSRQAVAGRMVARPDGLVAVSQSVADGLAFDLSLRQHSMNVIENPVWTPKRMAEREAPCPHPWLSARNALAPRLPISPEHAVIVGVGRLVTQKDFATLVTSLSRWPGIKKPRLILLGNGPLENDLRAQIASLGLERHVDLAGHVANVLPYLARADLFVMPSRWEGFGLALVEALGCGCPVVATDCPGGVRELLHNGKLGKLVPPGAPDALLEAITASLTTRTDPLAGFEAAQKYEMVRAAVAYENMTRSLFASDALAAEAR